MSWVRRLLLFAGLVTGAWLLGGAGEAHADVRVEIDQLKVELELPVVDLGVHVDTGLTPLPQEPPVSTPAPRVEASTPVVPRQSAPAPITTAPIHVETPQQTQAPQAPLMAPAPVPVVPEQVRLPELPVSGSLPQSGAGQSGGNQVPVGTLTCSTRPPTTTTSLVSTEQQDVPRIVRAEEPTFSPD